MSVLEAEYDGHVFVPSQPVTLPPGTRVDVVVRAPVRSMTVEENRQWQAFLDDLAGSEPEFPTVEDALARTRRRS